MRVETQGTLRGVAVASIRVYSTLKTSTTITALKSSKKRLSTHVLWFRLSHVNTASESPLPDFDGDPRGEFEGELGSMISHASRPLSRDRRAPEGPLALRGFSGENSDWYLKFRDAKGNKTVQ